MTVDMQKYTELLQDFSAISQAYINQETLDKLKARYKETINSKRVLENIVNIDSLLKVLEKRGVLQYNEISVLHQIAEIVQNSSIDDLIVNYEHWSTENFTTEINDLYSCGKSSNLIIISEHKISNQYKTENLCEILPENVPNLESEDQCNESLLSKESNATLNAPKYIDNKNIIKSTFIKQCSKKCKQKKYIFIIIIILLLILTIGVIGILVKISYLSTAIVPGVEQQTNASSNKFEPKMPLFRPNVNLEYSANHSSVYSSTTPVSHADREKEIQSLVVNRISRKIGRYWADVSRRLNIEEAYIEDIENRYIEETHSHEKMFKEALKIYFSEKNSNWKRDLMTALESSKRKDLKEEVEKMVY
ncbi:uncharacterized protein LOC103315410 isoform X1 [Nasonia vitripennis]|uniref:Death domain-containing protein n=1 Tax=Nasonia vitripennis TaxID=7425 RepID=A0A7M7Q3B4_NASVI|nr:uncharacterized protein LOC103315410 isoform X1 [Nasonia vitripennis]XP_032452610.1 uncharacterized protein LOC103315410 isoform X1 [Nasonia vitripennis]